MLDTEHSPVRVNDPTSDNHVVMVHPKQDFLVRFKTKEPVEVQVVSNYFRLIEEQDNCYKFSQIFDLSDWGDVSNVHLGDVVLCREKLNKLIGLTVLLESTNNRILTVINPTTTQLRVSPNQIVEFVVFGEDFDCGAADLHVVSGTGGLFYEELWQEIVDPKTYRRTPGRWSIIPRNGEFKELHCWFRLSKIGQVNLSGLDLGDHQGGEIQVSTQKSHHQVRLIVRKRYKEVSRTVIKTEEPKAICRYVPTQQFQQAQNRQNQRQLPQVGVVKLTEKPAVEMEEGCQWCLSEDYQPKSSIVLVGGGPENID